MEKFDKNNFFTKEESAQVEKFEKEVERKITFPYMGEESQKLFEKLLAESNPPISSAVQEGVGLDLFKRRNKLPKSALMQETLLFHSIYKSKP